MITERIIMFGAFLVALMAIVCVMGYYERQRKNDAKENIGTLISLRNNLDTLLVRMDEIDQEQVSGWKEIMKYVAMQTKTVHEIGAKTARIQDEIDEQIMSIAASNELTNNEIREITKDILLKIDPKNE